MTTEHFPLDVSLNRITGPSASRRMGQGIDTIDLDLDGFLIRLLLFDQYVLESVRLREFPQLLEWFGPFNLLNLLNDECLSIRCDADDSGIANLQQPSRQFEYALVFLRAADYKHYLSKCLSETPWTTLSDVGQNDRSRVIDGVMANIRPANPTDLTKLSEQLTQELPDRVEQLKKLTRLRLLQRNPGIQLPEDLLRKIHFEVEDLGNRVVNRVQSRIFYVKNNLCEVTKIREFEAHLAIGEAIEGLATHHHRLIKMDRDKAIGCYREGDLPAIGTDLWFINDALTPENRIDNFVRVVQVTGLPRMGEAAKKGELSIHGFFSIRNSNECKEFRDWLHRASNLDDEEIRDLTRAVVSRAKAIIGSDLGRMAICGMGYLVEKIPWAGTLLSTGLNKSYSWLLNRSGPALFLNNQYPSIFR